MNVTGAGFPQIQTCRNIFDKCSEEQNSARLRASSPVQVLKQLFRDLWTALKSYQIADNRGSSLGFSEAFGRGIGFGRLAYMHRTATKKQAQMSIAIRTGSGPIIHRLLHHYTETHGTFIRPIIMYIFSIIALIKTQAYIENLFNSSLIKARQLIGSNGSSRRCP